MLRSLRLRAATAAAIGLVTVTTACGSQVDPETFARAQGASGLTGTSGVPGEDGLTPAGSGSSIADGGGGGNFSGGTDASGGTSGDSGSESGKAPTGTGESAPDGGVEAASCDGFKNQTGITDDKVMIANASDISGPFPGLFQSARDATQAYVAYFNATSDICGRELEVLQLDTRTDAGGDQQAYAKACDEAFAAVGSMSGFDQGGAAAAEACGLPDIRAVAVSQERADCATCFGAQATNTAFHQNAVPDHILEEYPEAADKAAMVYLNAAGAAFSAESQVAADEKRGMNFVYVRGIDTSEFNYAPYVQDMKDAGVRYVQFIGPYTSAVKLAQAMDQQGFEPDVYALDIAAYNSKYPEEGGSAVDGTRVFINHALFTDTSNEEMVLYQAWLKRVNPSAEPDTFGLFAWSAARLFVQKSIELGGRLDRAALVGAVRGVKDWTANGLHAPQPVGPKTTGECWRWIRLEGSRWVPDTSEKYLCNGLTSGA